MKSFCLLSINAGELKYFLGGNFRLLVVNTISFCFTIDFGSATGEGHRVSFAEGMIEGILVGGTVNLVFWVFKKVCTYDSFE